MEETVITTPNFFNYFHKIVSEVSYFVGNPVDSYLRSGGRGIIVRKINESKNGYIDRS